MKKFKFHLNLKGITGTLHEYQYTCMMIPRSIFRRMKNISEKFCRENKVKVKLKFTYNKHRRPRGGVEVWFYSFFNLGGRWWGQRHTPAALPPGKTRYPFYRKLGGLPGPVWTGAKNLAPHQNSLSGSSNQ